MSESMCLAVQAVTAAALLSTVATADEAALQPGKPKMVWTQLWALESPFSDAGGSFSSTQTASLPRHYDWSSASSSPGSESDPDSGAAFAPRPSRKRPSQEEGGGSVWLGRGADSCPKRRVSSPEALCGGAPGHPPQGLASASPPWPLPLSAAGSTATATATTTAAAAAAATVTTAMHPGEQQHHHHHHHHHHQQHHQHQHQQQPLPPTGATAAALPVPATVAVPSQSLADLSLEAIALAREGMCRGIALLAARQHLGRERTERFLRLMEMISQVDGRDWSAGVASFLSHLLRTHPQAFRPDARSRQGLQAVAGGLARAGTRRESQGAAVLRRLTLDEAACCMVAAPGSAGGDFVVCSARMGELFCSSEEYTGMVNQTGVAAAYFWPRFVCPGSGLDELYTAMISIILDPFARPQLDVIVQCHTRDGREVRCVATVATHVTPASAGSFNVLKILPCLTRNFGPSPTPVAVV